MTGCLPERRTTKTICRVSPLIPNRVQFRTHKQSETKAYRDSADGVASRVGFVSRQYLVSCFFRTCSLSKTSSASLSTRSGCSPNSHSLAAACMPAFSSGVIFFLFLVVGTHARPPSCRWVMASKAASRIFLSFWWKAASKRSRRHASYSRYCGRVRRRFRSRAPATYCRPSYETMMWLKWPGTLLRHLSQSARYPILNDFFMPGWRVHELTVCRLRE